MAKDPKKENEVNQECEETLNTETQEGAEAQTEEVELTEAEKLAVELEESALKFEKLQKEYLLLMADFDNYRKRTLREKSDLLKSGGEDCLKKILPVIDDFERGLSAVNEGSDIEAVKEGMNLIYNKFLGYLTQQGIQEIAATGEEFNTEFHEAITVFPAPTPDLKGKVVDCVQKGYTLNEKVIRFAKVVVGE